ncbi:Protein kinase, catalytic domain-containing protein [Cynara cardunculus var. scolymus]|uniref:Protein kinase, catalytic domain-containing protein n=1 Tax=Cynara cardunculus var. scolymus TaxID=59895 RepID=A0A103XM84_CYNCS|nr:Protein kinase, catalytic domain-containing protein [Cynara cardunculus var. scolymus]
MFILCGLYRAITFISTKVAKSTNTKVTNPTPISLEVKVRLPTRVIFGDDQTLRRFDPSELVQLPKNRLGEGSLGTLYKVVLDCGLTITIRRIRKEITSVGDFEYWVRQQITLGAAKAVASIHSRFTETGEPLVCGVIKSSNFLLQADFSPRLSSYETPYFISPSTIIRRNCGRMAPELTRTRRISKSFTQASDVYSFGILMLELISGKKPSVTNLGQYVAEKRKREGPKGVPDKRMSDVTENVSLMIIIAGHCLSSDPKQRPSMGRIVEMIQAALE